MKKLLSIILAVVIALSCCTGIITYAVQDDTYDHLPQVYIEGFESKRVYYKGDENKTSLLYPIDSGRMSTATANIKNTLTDSIKSLDFHLVYNCVYGWMDELLGDTKLEPDGITMQPNVTVDATELNYKGDGKYVFKYDSRLDPVDLAKELDEYISWVKEDTGSEKIELVGSSFGSSVELAYMSEYGTDCLDSILFCVPSMEGINFVSQLFTGDFHFDADAVEAFASNAIGNDAVTTILQLLNESGILRFLIDTTVEPLLKVALKNALHDAIHDILATHPAMWAFVKAEYFDEAIEYVFGADKDTYSQLIEKVTYYHENIKVKDRDILKKAIDDGHHVSIICKYNMPPFPFTYEGNFMGDGFVETTVASLGATCAMNGESFADDYKQKLYPEKNHMSPDWCIDASTCFLPDNTWFVKDLAHGDKNDSYYGMINYIIYNDIDVFTDPNCPQFLQNISGYVVPTQDGKFAPKDTFIQHIFKLLKQLFTIIVEKIKSLFN